MSHYSATKALRIKTSYIKAKYALVVINRATMTIPIATNTWKREETYFQKDIKIRFLN